MFIHSHSQNLVVSLLPYGVISRKNFSKFTHSRKFFSKFTQTRFFGESGKFSETIGKLSEIGEICTNLGEKGKITRSRKKQGRFTHSRNRKIDFHVHASFFNSRIHAIFFRFSRIYTTKNVYSTHSRKPLGGPYKFQNFMSFISFMKELV